MPCYPDYDNSILSIAASVLRHFNAPCGHAGLPTLDALLEKDHKNVIVMLFDGMGASSLRMHLPEESFLRRHMVSEISSVFPPTTTAATLSMETGLSPIEHGWLGWSLYFEELDANVSIFPNTLSGSDGAPAADYHVARRYIPAKSIRDKITEATGGEVMAAWVSPFSNHAVRGVPELCDTVAALCAGEGRKYIYTYWHQPDYDMHELGVGHERAAEHIAQINERVERMCESLRDALVIVTADHGLIDTSFKTLADYPEIADCLVRAPSIESRAMALFVKGGCHERFKELFLQAFGDDYLLLTRREALDMKLFGRGVPHPRAEGFMGSFLAIATGDISIQATASAEHGVFKAAHAGLTRDEMRVPLIAIERG